MNNTLQLFDELLEHDSGSKIFFPLARLYRKQGHTQRAIEIVQKGIEHHPDYLEAQLFLIELLDEVGDSASAENRAHSVFSKLLSYEKFWFSLRSFFLKSEQSSLSLAAFLVEQSARGSETDLFQILNLGISHYDELQSCKPVDGEPEVDLDAEEVTLFCINSGIKTKTMAKLLVAQGEYAQAIAIYDDLLEDTLVDDERADLIGLRKNAQKELGETPDPEVEKSTKLYNVLTSLATRLEDKASAGHTD